MQDLSKLRHDFNNCSMRIEIISRLVVEQIDSNTRIDNQLLEDLQLSLDKMNEFLNDLRS